MVRRGWTRSILRASRACDTWVPGPSTSPLEAMTRSAAVLLGAVVVLASAAVWVLVPPFPSAETLMDRPLPALVKQFGAPQEAVLPSWLPTRLRPARSVEWVVSRGVAVWTLGASWNKPSTDFDVRPDSVSRCLRLRWVPEWTSVVLFLPCDFVARGSIMASNNRWRGPCCVGGLARLARVDIAGQPRL